MSDTDNIIEENKNLTKRVEELESVIAKQISDYDELLAELEAKKAEGEDEEEVQDEDAQGPEDDDDDDEEYTEEEEDAEEDEEDEAVSELDAKLADLENAVANLSTSPVITEGDSDQPLTGEQARDQFSSISDWQERSRFFAEHRETLLSK